MSEYDNKPLRVMARKTGTCNICYEEIGRGDRLCKLGQLVSCAKHEAELIELVMKTRNRVRELQRKLTDDQIREIRSLYEQGETQTFLASKYSVAQKTIGDVVNRVTFKDVT